MITNLDAVKGCIKHCSTSDNPFIRNLTGRIVHEESKEGTVIFLELKVPAFYGFTTGLDGDCIATAHRVQVNRVRFQRAALTNSSSQNIYYRFFYIYHTQVPPQIEGLSPHKAKPRAQPCVIGQLVVRIPSRPQRPQEESVRTISDGRTIDECRPLQRNSIVRIVVSILQTTIRSIAMRLLSPFQLTALFRVR